MVWKAGILESVELFLAQKEKLFVWYEIDDVIFDHEKGWNLQKFKNFQPNSGEPTKLVGIKCCDMDGSGKECRLDYGLHPDCKPIDMDCVVGCIPVSNSSTFSEVS